MSEAEPSVYASLPATIIRFAEALGVPREDLLTAADLDEAALADPDELVPYETLIGVWSVLLARFPGEPLGLRYAEVVPMTIFGALGYAMAHCHSARRALQAYLRFQSLLDPYIEVKTVEDAGRVRIVVDHEPRVRAMPEVMEMMIGAMHRHAVELVFGSLETPPPGLEVAFSHPPQHPEAVYAGFFGRVPVRFEAGWNGTELDAHLLDLPIPAADPGLGRHLVANLETQLAARPLAASPSTADRVRQRIEASLADGAPTQAEVAEALDMATRTLQRRLEADGTAFSAVLDDVRRSRAELLLMQPNLSVSEVAYLLGYSEPRAFHRSFRRWTGASAGAWRAARGVK